jgi:hypothetical protein
MAPDTKRLTPAYNWLCLALVALVLLLPSTVHAAARYQLAARINLTHGAVSDIAWLDSDKYLTLVISPQATEVYRHGYDLPRRQRFMSADFMATYICSPELAGRLQWTLSPEKRYLFFSWFLDNGSPRWQLVDVADAPNFRLKRFAAPPGMRISRAVFSPDDRYAVLVHDARHGDCDVSVLVLDLENGMEVWRISTQELNFISEVWWGGAVLDSPRCYASAKLYDGQFEPYLGLARLDIASRELRFTTGDASVICGTAALWGKLECYAAATGASEPFFLRAEIPGQQGSRDILLSAEPVAIKALDTPGLVLLSNTVDWVTNQLWLIDIFSGEKYLVDADSAGFSIADDGKLLVRARKSIELKVYELVDTSDNGAESMDDDHGVITAS